MLLLDHRITTVQVAKNDLNASQKKEKKAPNHFPFRALACLPFPPDIRVVQDICFGMDVQGLFSRVDQLAARVQSIQDYAVQTPALEPRIPTPDPPPGDRSKLLNPKNNCKPSFALKPRSSGDPTQQAKITISLPHGDPQDRAPSPETGDPAPLNADAFFQALGPPHDQPNPVDHAEKTPLAPCQGQEAAVILKKFRKWSVPTKWNEEAPAATLRKGPSETPKDATVGPPTPAGLSESTPPATQTDRRPRERKAAHHMAASSEQSPEPMQCDRTPTRIEQQESRRQNRPCPRCGDPAHAIPDCPKRTKRVARSATTSTTQPKSLLSLTPTRSPSSPSAMAPADPGAAPNPTDPEFARRRGPSLQPPQSPTPPRGTDATPPAKDKPHYWTQMTMHTAPAHQEDRRPPVLHNPHDAAVLGPPRPQEHNPVPDWKTTSVTSWGCRGAHSDAPLMSTSSSPPSEVPEPPPDPQDAPDEPKSSPPPPHRDRDRATNPTPGCKFPKGRPFNRSAPEHAATRSHAKESPEKGHTRPPSSPPGAGLPLAAKKDGSLRPRTDHRPPNKITVKFQHPPPLPTDLPAQINPLVTEPNF